jgi:MoxR-like ATPase
MTAPTVAVTAEDAPGDAPADKKLVAFVPDKALVASYVSRKIHGVQDLAIYDYARLNAFNILIEGPTGIGKTMSAMAYAASRNLLFYATPSSVALEPSQLFGRHTPQGPNYYPWVDGPVTQIMRNGGVLLLNEVGFIPPRISTVLFPALDIRRAIQLLDNEGEVVRAHRPDCWCDLPQAECKKKWVLFVADTNPGYKGTTELNDAFRNRFHIQQTWGYDKDVELKLLPAELVTAANQLRNSQEISTPVGTNMLMDLVAMAASGLGWDFAIGNFISRFHPDERDVVRGMVDLKNTRLKAQLTKATRKPKVQPAVQHWHVTDDQLRNTRGTQDNTNPLGYPDYDPDDGIYGVPGGWILEAYDDGVADGVAS